MIARGKGVTYKKKEMRTFKQFLDEQIQDPEFAKEYTEIQPEMDAILAMMDRAMEKGKVSPAVDLSAFK